MLEINGLTSGYGRLKIIRDLSLTLQPGEFAGIFGRNGAGKSTLAATIMGVIKPSGGQITLDGESLLKTRTEIRVKRGLSLVPQSRGLFMELTVQENMLLSCSAWRLSKTELRDREQEMYERFPVLWERRGLLASNLSGGEQQMLAIAKALIRRPDVLILDEPSMGLAPKILESIAELIEGLRGSGLTFLITEQNIRWALGMVDVGYVLEQGEIVEKLDTNAGVTEVERTMARYLGGTDPGAKAIQGAAK